MIPARLLLFFLGIGLLTAAQATERDSLQIERALAKSLEAISNSRLDLALKEVDSLLRTAPNFKLAQLLKGDLLLARARPLNDFGNVPNAPHDQLQDLRDEARARLLRIRQQRPLEQVPRFLWQLDPEQRYAIVVDSSKSTLFVYENVNGEARYVTDFYVSIGKKGIDKSSQGDQKTPLGVYYINASLPREKLTDFYGPGAFPLNYPNEWDRRLGRNGHGIWLHGTPSDTYSRPPRASNGCVVLSNDDFVKLSRYVQVGRTPVIITPQIDWSDERDLAERKELLQSIEQWRKDWASLDTEAYLGHYASDFSTGRQDLNAFAQQKRLVNAGKSWIRIKLNKLSIFPYPNQPGLVVVNFEQDYRSNNLNDRMNKRQYWQKRNGRWQIIYEGAA